MEFRKIRTGALLLVALIVLSTCATTKSTVAQDHFNKNERLHLEVFATGYMDENSRFILSRSVPPGMLSAIKVKVTNHGDEDSGVFRVVAHNIEKRPIAENVSELKMPLIPKQSDDSFLFTFKEESIGKQTYRIFIIPRAEAVAVLEIK